MPGRLRLTQVLAVLLWAVCTVLVGAADTDHLVGEPTPCPRHHPFASADGKECCVHKYSDDDECHPSYDAVPCPNEPCAHFSGGSEV